MNYTKLRKEGYQAMEQSFENRCYNIAKRVGYNMFSVEEKNTEFGKLIFLDDEFSRELTTIKSKEKYYGTQNANEEIKNFFTVMAEEQKNINEVDDQMKEKNILDKLEELLEFLDNNRNEIEQLIEDNRKKDENETKLFIIKPSFIDDKACTVYAKNEDEAIEEAKKFFGENGFADFVKGIDIVDVSE